MNMNKLDAIASKIKEARDLWDLHAALIEFEIAANTDDDEGRPMPAQEEADTENLLKWRGIDICDLPTFGGEDPASTDGVWSWDEDYILAGEGAFRDWEIRERGAR